MRKLASIFAALWISAAVPAWAVSFPGPDDFGHIAAAIPFNLRDISASGTFVNVALLFANRHGGIYCGYGLPRSWLFARS